MLYSGLKISQSATLPAAPQEGQLACLTAVDGSHNPGTYIYRSGQWRVMDESSQSLTVTEGMGINASITGNELTIEVDTLVMATNSSVDTKDAATLQAAKDYSDAIKHNFDYKDSVYCASTGNITLSGSRTIDGQTPPNGSRVLVKDNTDATQNGIYITNNSGAWTRASDAASDAAMTAGSYVYVERGTVNQKTAWVLSTTDAVIGTSQLLFVPFGITTYTANGGIQLVGSNFSLTDTGVTAGNYGSTTQVPVLTLDAKGRIAGVSLATISASVPSSLTPYDICSCVIGKPDAGATVFMALAVRSFTIPNGYTASQAKAGTAATASSVFTIYKNGGSIGTFTFAASGSTATFSGTGGSIVAGDLITIVAPGAQDATLANIAFTLAGNLQ